MTDEHPQPLAIDGGPPVRTDPWPTDPEPAPADDRDAAAALVRELSALLGAEERPARLVAGPAEARAAVLAALPARGREVAVPDLGADAWVESIAAAGLVPMPVEVDAESAALSPRGLSRVLGEETRAVIVLHPFGHPAAVTELRRLIGPREVPLVEDASGALGASERGRPAGALGDVSVVRLGAADDASAAAAVTWTAGAAGVEDAPPDTAAARRALGWLRAEVAALELRRHAAWELTFGIRGMRGAAGMPHGRAIRHAYSVYVVRLRSLLWRRTLDATIDALRAEGIACTPAAGRPLHASERLGALLGAGDPRLDADHFPVAQRLPGELLAIPLAAVMTQHDVNEAVAALRKLEAAWQ